MSIYRLFSNIAFLFVIFIWFHILGSYRCNICTKRMKNINEVIAHQRQEHLNKRNATCDVCGRQDLSSSSLKPHIWSHKSALDVLDAINSGEKVPARHEKTLNQRQETLAEYGVQFEFDCKVCQSTFTMLEEFYSHIMEQHPQTLTTVIQRRPQAEYRKRGPKSKFSLEPSDCPECGKTYATEYKCRKHIQRVHRRKLKGSSRGKRKSATASGSKQNEKQSKTNIKTEISSGSSESDVNESENEYENYASGNSSDPEFKSVSKVKVLETSGITLRNRASLRARRDISYNEDDISSKYCTVRLILGSHNLSQPIGVCTRFIFKCMYSALQITHG